MFYVYELIDPRNDLPFYVGKGSGNRLFEHRTDAMRGATSHRHHKIRQIIALGLQIKYRIVRHFKVEAAAYRFEARHIERIGPTNLTNIAAGGIQQPIAKPQTIDRQWLNILTQIRDKTENFTVKKRFWYGQMWHELPDGFLPAMRARYEALRSVGNNAV